MRALRQAGLLEGRADELPELETLRACVVEQTAATPPPPQQTSSVERWADKIAELRPKAGPTAIHDFLRLDGPDYAGSLSAVKRVCLRLRREQGPVPEEVAIPVETAPGEVAHATCQIPLTRTSALPS